ncbi:hypothetical protein ABT160_37955 [Streptomyces sp. NPDC001941]|uniref:hypothetical protein n=1 Tax=Streptomyces sp. NPDC001941 TaxID=3154659 RepID=UPI00332BA1D1
MGRREVRRAAGTQAVSDLLRHPKRLAELLVGAAPARAEADLVALRAGEARAVAAFPRIDGRFRQGLLILDPGAPTPVLWRPYRLLGRVREDVVLTGPFHVHGASQVTGRDGMVIDKEQFRLLSLRDADRPWEIAVPVIDLPLVRAALHAVNVRD